MRDEMTKAGTRFGHCDFEKGLSSVIHRPGFKPHLLPHFDVCEFGQIVSSLNFRAPCISSGDQHDNAYLLGVRINEVRKMLTSMPGTQKAYSTAR